MPNAQSLKPKAFLIYKLLLLEARKQSALVVAIGGSCKAENERLAADGLVDLDLRHRRSVVRSPKGGALVAVSSLRIRHFVFSLLLLLAVEGVLAQSRVVLHQFQASRSVSLVLGRRVIILTIFRTYDTDDFSGFGLLCHSVSFVLPKPRNLAGQPKEYDPIFRQISTA